jgi:protease-4
MTENPAPKSWGLGNLMLFIILPLAAGILFSLLIPTPQIGLIRLDVPIQADSAKDLLAQIDYARTQDQIKAVVLVLDSPGGTVTDTESVYMELARLRQNKPVVSVVESMAASGAYYLAVDTDYIIAKPSSMVGNVGVLGSLPPAPTVYENVISTGPYKLFGSPRDTYMRQVEMLKQGFFKAVQLGRGSTLKLTPEELLSGQIWPGAEALRFGVIDEIGTQSSAFEKAAVLAKISHYQTVELRKAAGLPVQPTVQPFYGSNSKGEKSSLPEKDGFYYLYVPPAEKLP